MAEKFLIWISSFLILVLLLYVSYKISYKLGIKKALYRTTYIILSVIFAFVLAPVVTNKLLGMDLSNFNITLYYEDKSFFTVIDYIEEVIAHNDFLNDLYQYFPSLKSLLMDFPQLLLVPIIYVLLFIVFIIVLLPLYLYLSYKRKRRILYERADKKSQRVWSGILGCVQCIFIISVTFSPLNGLSRIYQNATNNTLENEYGSLCDEHEALKKYKVYCDILESYNSTVFATIGGNDSVSDFVFDSLTRISYEDGNTSLANEASLIIKSGIVLNQSGLLEIVNSDSIDGTVALSFITENKLTDEDIDVIVDTLANSKYSEEILTELSAVLPTVLNGLLQYILNDDLYFDYSIDKEYIINEIKVVLKALTLLSNSTLLNDLFEARNILINYDKVIPENRKNMYTAFEFFIELVDSVDLDDVEMFGEYLVESKIFNQIIPYILDNFLNRFGFNFVATGSDILDQFYNIMDVARLIKKYRPADVFELFASLNKDELMLAAEIIEYVISSPDTRGFVKYLLTEIFKNSFDYFPSDVFAIKNWTIEVYVLRDVCKLVIDVKNGEKIGLYDINKILDNKEYENSELIAIGYRMAAHNVPYLFEQLILYLAG